MFFIGEDGIDMGFTDGLSDIQKEAVQWGKGPALVLSGAGSGKTRVITHRTAQLMESGINPGSILVTTFTKKAAEEMQGRLDNLVGVESLSVKMGTFHSIFFGLLRQAWSQDRDPLARAAVMTAGQNKFLRSQVLKQTTGFRIETKDLKSMISYLKNHLIHPDEPIPAEMHEILQKTTGFPDVRPIEEAFSLYEALKTEQNLIDYDDMPLMAYDLLSDRENGWLDHCHEAWKYFMVDEFQDTNVAQYEILKMLCPADRNPNLFVVGDDDQAIYGWRGSMPEYIVGFCDRYKAKKFVMGRNYRSVEQVVEHASILIGNNKGRLSKELVADRGAAEEGESPRIRVISSKSDRVEAQKIVKQILEIKDKAKLRWRDFAIIYRTNAQSKAVEDTFITQGLPYHIVGGLGFYARKEVRDLLAFLKLAVDPTDFDAFKRVINVPNRYLGRAFVASFTNVHQLRTSVLDTLFAMKLKSFQEKGIYEFIGIVRAAEDAIKQMAVDEKMTVGSVIEAICAKAKYLDYLKKEEDDHDDGSSRIDNVSVLVLGANEFPDPQSFMDYTEHMQAKAAAPEDPTGDKVSMMSIHRSKGLEFPVVCIIGASDGIIPHEKSTKTKQIEEERRLFYVAMTRAMDYLVISSLLEYRNQELEPSRFIEESLLEVSEEVPA